MIVSNNPQDNIWNWYEQSSHAVWFAKPFPLYCQPQARFGSVEDDLSYQPWYKRHSLPPYCPYLATSNISCNNKVNTHDNGQCSEKELLATAGWQIWQNNKPFHTTTSSGKWGQERLGSREPASPWGIMHHAIQKEACRRDAMRNSLLKQWSERQIDLA